MVFICKKKICLEKWHRKENITPEIPIYFYKKKTCNQEKSVSEKVVTILNHKNHYAVENSGNVNYFIEFVNNSYKRCFRPSPDRVFGPPSPTEENNQGYILSSEIFQQFFTFDYPMLLLLDGNSNHF